MKPLRGFDRVLSALLAAKVDFVVIGGCARLLLPELETESELAELAGAVRGTADIDVATPDVMKAISALRKIGYEPADREVRRTLIDRGSPARDFPSIDLIESISGETIEVGSSDRELLRPVGSLGTRLVTYEQWTFQIASPVSLLVLKAISAGDPWRQKRERDLADIGSLALRDLAGPKEIREALDGLRPRLSTEVHSRIIKVRRAFDGPDLEGPEAFCKAIGGLGRSKETSAEIVSDAVRTVLADFADEGSSP